MCIPTFVDFFLFHLFFCFFRFLFPSFPFSLLAGTLWHFFLLFAFVCQPLNSPALRSIPIFFFRFFLYHCKVTIVKLPPVGPPHTFINSSNHSLLGRWSTSGSEGGNAHFFTATRIRSRGPEKIEGQTNKHEQCLGLTQSRRRVCNTTFPIAYMDKR